MPQGMFFYEQNLRRFCGKFGGKMFRRFIKREDGATAVEFAIVGIPFTFCLIAVIEITLMYAANSMLEGATNSAARLIRTGQVQQSGMPEDLFKNQLCNFANVFLDCNAIQYEVVTLPGGFSDADSNQPSFDQNGDLIPQGFDPGGVNDVVLIRSVYRYRFMTPVIGPLMASGPNQTKTMMTTLVLQTEPYEF